MAASVTVNERTVQGNKRVTFSTVTFDSSYPTGGESVTAAQLGLSKVDWATPTVKTIGGTVNVANVTYDRTNSKFKVYDETPAEVANTADLSTLVVEVRAEGI